MNDTKHILFDTVNNRVVAERRELKDLGAILRGFIASGHSPTRYTIKKGTYDTISSQN